MKTYSVEVMAGDEVASYHVAEADTPWEAAEKATGKPVQGRRAEWSWVLVTDERSRAYYKYAFKFDASNRL
ncbi:hypothetical protein [Mesorhizobium sp. WSM3860]|uniref:hypothetical protein n=1 Tax=Mesorhizobium sp. WSM3860 TaxID=2029403 RepID=UPI000BB058AD|nr:hypothetical protein [Mesorhizobium sp. WSM3860]PBC02659.1 hypothetical protein CK220_19500 [Mesorhizobium sp. WSM3860]